MRLSKIKAGVLVLIALALLANGCVPTASKKPGAGKDASNAEILAIRLIKRARALELKDDYYRAHALYRAAAEIAPTNQNASRRAGVLKKKIDQLAKKHYNRGVSYYKKGDTLSARREFLRALSYDPAHTGAVDHLVKKLHEELFVYYVVKKGDTLKKISKKIYASSEYDFVIGFFNNLKKTARLAEGMHLRMPPRAALPLDTLRKPKKPAKAVIEDGMKSTVGLAKKAWEFFTAGKYASARKTVDQALEQDIANTRALELVQKMLKLAEQKYVDGLKSFVAENMEKAVELWSDTLELNPEHPHAKKDLEKARGLLKKLKNR